MTEEARLLRAICGDPADDTPRLAYADWLDEHQEEVFDPSLCSGTHRHDGVPETVIHGVYHDTNPRQLHHHHDEKCYRNDRKARAEFIRTQIEITKPIECKGWGCPLCTSPAVKKCAFPPEDCGCGQKRAKELLHKREMELFNPNWLPDTGTWTREWYFSALPKGYDRDQAFGYLVRRGFPCEIICRENAFVHYAREIAQAPIERVTLDDKIATYGATTKEFQWHKTRGVGLTDESPVDRHLNAPYRLEPELFAGLLFTTFSSREAADKELNRACLKLLEAKR